MQTHLKFTPNKLIERLRKTISLVLLLRAIIYRRNERIRQLEAQLKELNSRWDPTSVPNPTYPAEMINIAVQTVVHAEGSLRCAAKVAGYYCNLMGWHYGTPSHNTVCNWVKRLGLYALDHQGSKVGRYIGKMAEKLIETVNEYFEHHLNLVKKYGRLICCSDIIESTFGRYKNKGGMKVISADVLAIPLYALKMDVEFVVKGLTTIFTEPDKSMA